MKRMVLALTLLALLGCSSSMHGTAPAKDGFIYAVGSKVEAFRGEQPQVWLCPAAKKGECQRVNVTTEEE